MAKDELSDEDKIERLIQSCRRHFRYGTGPNGADRVLMLSISEKQLRDAADRISSLRKRLEKEIKSEHK